jgi:hypothetical protein
MDRRHFLLTSLAGAVAAPLAAEARQPDRIYSIGVLEVCHARCHRDRPDDLSA